MWVKPVFFAIVPKTIPVQKIIVSVDSLEVQTAELILLRSGNLSKQNLTIEKSKNLRFSIRKRTLSLADNSIVITTEQSKPKMFEILENPAY